MRVIVMEIENCFQEAIISCDYIAEFFVEHDVKLPVSGEVERAVIYLYLYYSRNQVGPRENAHKTLEHNRQRKGDIGQRHTSLGALHLCCGNCKRIRFCCLSLKAVCHFIVKYSKSPFRSRCL